MNQKLERTNIHSKWYSWIGTKVLGVTLLLLLIPTINSPTSPLIMNQLLYLECKHTHGTWNQLLGVTSDTKQRLMILIILLWGKFTVGNNTYNQSGTYTDQLVVIVL